MLIHSFLQIKNNTSYFLRVKNTSKIFLKINMSKSQSSLWKLSQRFQILKLHKVKHSTFDPNPSVIDQST